MTQDEWDRMTNLQRHEYLSAGEIEIKKQTALNGKAKVGSSDAVKVYSSAHCRGVQVSQWHEIETEALQEAEDFIEGLSPAVGSKVEDQAS